MLPIREQNGVGALWPSQKKVFNEGPVDGSKQGFLFVSLVYPTGKDLDSFVKAKLYSPVFTIVYPYCLYPLRSVFRINFRSVTGHSLVSLASTQIVLLGVGTTV